MRQAQHFANSAVNRDGAEADLTEALRSAFGAQSAVAAQGAVLVGRVHGWGGDPAVFARMLADAVAALATASGSVSDAGFRALGTVAAWRSGARGFRAAALKALGSLHTDAAAACLGIAGAELAGFLTAQQSDRYAFPRLALVGSNRDGWQHQVAEIGGFAGFGGPWLRPPRPISDGSGMLLVMTGDDTWRVTADAFGHRITRVAEAEHSAEFDTDNTTENGVLEVIEDSYFLRLHATTVARP